MSVTVIQIRKERDRQVDAVRDERIGYWITRGYANSRIANSRTGQVAISQMPPKEYPVYDLAIRELAYPRVVQLPRNTYPHLA